MDEGVFEHVVLEHKDRICGYAALMLRDPAEAQDVTQEALVRLWQHRTSVDVDGAQFWLRRTVHNLCVDRIRRRRSRPETRIESEELLGASPPGEGPLRRLESAELARRIDRALGALPARDRALIVLREVQGVTYNEIARLLDQPLGTVKARLHRAREALRARLIRAKVTP